MSLIEKYVSKKEITNQLKVCVLKSLQSNWCFRFELSEPMIRISCPSIDDGNNRFAIYSPEFGPYLATAINERRTELCHRALELADKAVEEARLRARKEAEEVMEATK